MLAVGQILGVAAPRSSVVSSPPPPPLPHLRRPKWCRDDGQSIKTVDRSHHEFRLILHRRLITHTRRVAWERGRRRRRYIFIYKQASARIYHIPGKDHRVEEDGVCRESERAVADDGLAENGAISRHHKGNDGGREGESALHRANAVIDYGNIFSVEAKVKQHTSRSSLSRGHSNCDLWRRRKRCS